MNTEYIDLDRARCMKLVEKDKWFEDCLDGQVEAQT